MGNIRQLKWWAYKILPLAYDDSLSYYEAMDKCVNKVNELVNTVNDLPSNVSEEIKKQLEGDGDVFNNLFSGLANAIATKESDSITFTHNDKHGGEIIWLGDTLYEVVAEMVAGTNYIVGTNIVPVDIDSELNKIENFITTHNEYYHTRATAKHSAQSYMYWKGDLYRVDSDIAVNDIISVKKTVNGETSGQLSPVNILDEVTAHYIEMHESDNNLQTQIDENENDINNLQNLVNTNNTNVNNRINNIVAQTGDANSEVVDARLFDNCKYNSLHDAIAVIGDKQLIMLPNSYDGSFTVNGTRGYHNEVRSPVEIETSEHSTMLPPIYTDKDIYYYPSANENATLFRYYIWEDNFNNLKINGNKTPIIRLPKGHTYYVDIRGVEVDGTFIDAPTSCTFHYSDAIKGEHTPPTTLPWGYNDDVSITYQAGTYSNCYLPMYCVEDCSVLFVTSRAYMGLTSGGNDDSYIGNIRFKNFKKGETIFPYITKGDDDNATNYFKFYILDYNPDVIEVPIYGLNDKTLDPVLSEYVEQSGNVAEIIRGDIQNYKVMASGQSRLATIEAKEEVGTSYGTVLNVTTKAFGLVTYTNGSYNSLIFFKPKAEYDIFLSNTAKDGVAIGNKFETYLRAIMHARNNIKCVIDNGTYEVSNPVTDPSDNDISYFRTDDTVWHRVEITGKYNNRQNGVRIVFKNVPYTKASGFLSRSLHGIENQDFPNSGVTLKNITLYGDKYTPNKPFTFVNLTDCGRIYLEDVYVRGDGSAYEDNTTVYKPSTDNRAFNVGYGSNFGIQQHVKNCMAYQVGIGYNCNGEHFVFEDCLIHHGMIGFCFGGDKTRVNFEHPNVLIGCSVEYTKKVMMFTSDGVFEDQPNGTTPTHNTHHHSIVVVGLSTEPWWHINPNGTEPEIIDMEGFDEVYPGLYSGYIIGDFPADKVIYHGCNNIKFLTFNVTGDGKTYEINHAITNPNFQ